MSRGHFWHILTWFLPIAAIELSLEQVDYWKRDNVIDRRWVVNWSNIYYCLGTHKNRHCLTTFLRLSGCIQRCQLLLPGYVHVCYDFVVPWSSANETTNYNILFTLIHETILNIIRGILFSDERLYTLVCAHKAFWVFQDVFFIFNSKYLISWSLNDIDFKPVLFHCFRNAKINISSVENSSNQHNLAVLINVHLYLRIKDLIFALVCIWENYITALSWTFFVLTIAFSYRALLSCQHILLRNHCRATEFLLQLCSWKFYRTCLFTQNCFKMWTTNIGRHFSVNEGKWYGILALAAIDLRLTCGKLGPLRAHKVRRSTQLNSFVFEPSLSAGNLPVILAHYEC